MKHLFSKIKNLMTRGIVTLLESGGYQVTLLNGETRSNLEHLQEFGLASVKPDGVNGNGVCVFYGGNRSNGSLLVMEFPDIKPTLAAGESAVYNAHGAIAKLTAAGVIELNGSGNAGLIKIADLVTYINSHTHATCTSTGTPTPPIVPIVQANIENTKVVH
jgi:phage gp45-like